MLNPKFRRYADRIKALIEEGRELASNSVLSSDLNSDIAPWEASAYIVDTVGLNSWFTRVNNIVEITFGPNSPQFSQVKELVSSKTYSQPSDIEIIEGVLLGALDDLESGFLVGQEFLVAGEIFETILEESRHLNETGHETAAAVLARVVLEDTLKRLARQENIQDDKKATVLNEKLWKASRYGQPQWRLIQAWLDIGNAAAHGNFNEYDQEKVRTQIDGIEQFLANEFR